MEIIRERTDHVVGLPIDSGGSRGSKSDHGTRRRIRDPCELLASLRKREPGGSPRDRDRSRARRRPPSPSASPPTERCSACPTSTRASGRSRSGSGRAGWIPADAAIAECDVLAPCALGGTIDGGNVERLYCEIVCGAANNVLAERSLADRLAEREILYAPDFIANAGGLISVYGELHSLGTERLDSLVDGIGEALRRVFEVARRGPLHRSKPPEASPRNGSAPSGRLTPSCPSRRTKLAGAWSVQGSTEWLEGYERAWRTPGTAVLAQLFAEDAIYSTAPYEMPHRGLAADRRDVGGGAARPGRGVRGDERDPPRERATPASPGSRSATTPPRTRSTATSGSSV